MKFERVSETQYQTDLFSAMHSGKLRVWAEDDQDITYMDVESIPLPKRGTAGSAGYDFYSPVETLVTPGESALIPTGIRCKLDPGQVLLLFPRSSLGMKYRLWLDNTVGVVDEDYYHATNQGHIMVQISNNSETACHITRGTRFTQGIVVSYAVAEDDATTEIRTGGMGSTGE